MHDINIIFFFTYTHSFFLQVIYAYPNEYTVGITSLGYQLVWAFFETHPEVSISRLFTDVGDPVPASPDLVGFSFAWELDYSNLLTLLEQLHIPIQAADRDDSHPLVFGGGPVLTANPEPYADFFGTCIYLVLFIYLFSMAAMFFQFFFNFLSLTPYPTLPSVQM